MIRYLFKIRSISWFMGYEWECVFISSAWSGERNREGELNKRHLSFFISQRVWLLKSLGEGDSRQWSVEIEGSSIKVNLCKGILLNDLLQRSFMLGTKFREMIFLYWLSLLVIVSLLIVSGLFFYTGLGLVDGGNHCVKLWY